MERSDGYFRHHALFNRRFARHSGEDAGRAFHGGTINSRDFPADIQEVIGSFTGRIPTAVRDRVLPEAFVRPTTSIRNAPVMDPQERAPNRWAGLDPWARPGVAYAQRSEFEEESEGMPDTSAKGPKKSRKRKASGGAVSQEVKQRIAQKKAVADEQRKQKVIRSNVKKIAKNAKGKIPKGLKSLLG